MEVDVECHPGRDYAGHAKNMPLAKGMIGRRSDQLAAFAHGQSADNEALGDLFENGYTCAGGERSDGHTVPTGHWPSRNRNGLAVHQERESHADLDTIAIAGAGLVPGDVANLQLPRLGAIAGRSIAE